MKTLLTARSIRNTMMTFAAVSAMALPLLTSASVSNNNVAVRVVYDKSDLDRTKGTEELYVKLQNASRKICGSTRLIATGSLRRSAGNKECYNGTLTAAVERLDNAAVTALHNK